MNKSRNNYNLIFKKHCNLNIYMQLNLLFEWIIWEINLIIN